MAAESPIDVLLLRLSWYNCFHSSEKKFRIKMLNSRPQETLEFC